QQIAGSGGRHSEWPIHSEILRVRADVQVVAHTHPFHACVFSASLDPLAPYTLDADYFLAVPRHEDPVALITTKQEGAALARALGLHFAVLMANHGVTFCGTSVMHATCVGIFLEKACKAQLAGSAAGFRAGLPDAATRMKRHGQIMTPTHWEHSWNYFCRKLHRAGDRPGRPPPAAVRLIAPCRPIAATRRTPTSAGRCAGARASASCAAKAGTSTTSFPPTLRIARSCAARTHMRASARSTPAAPPRCPARCW